MKSKLKTTVVMTTYNGDEYIIDQLDSLKNQTRKPNEVLIFDDCSTDNTVSCIRNYIEKNQLHNWHIYVNKNNKGWKRNFYDAITSANNDLIFPCDQDDIWHLDKIEKMSEIMEENLTIDVLVGLPHKLFVKGRKESYGLWNIVAVILDRLNFPINLHFRNGQIKRRKFSRNFLVLEPGCCFCIRNDFAKRIETYWFPELGHDAFFTFYSLIDGNYYHYNKEIIEWRQHTGSASRQNMHAKEIRLSEIHRNENVINALLKYIENNNVEDYEYKKIVLLKANKWNVIRHAFINEGHISDGIKLMKYYSFYERKRAMFTDWLYAKK